MQVYLFYLLIYLHDSFRAPAHESHSGDIDATAINKEEPRRLYLKTPSWKSKP